MTIWIVVFTALLILFGIRNEAVYSIREEILIGNNDLFYFLPTYEKMLYTHLGIWTTGQWICYAQKQRAEGGGEL